MGNYIDYVLMALFVVNSIGHNEVVASPSDNHRQLSLGRSAVESTNSELTEHGDFRPLTRVKRDKNINIQIGYLGNPDDDLGMANDGGQRNDDNNNRNRNKDRNNNRYVTYHISMFIFLVNRLIDFTLCPTQSFFPISMAFEEIANLPIATQIEPITNVTTTTIVMARID